VYLSSRVLANNFQLLLHTELYDAGQTPVPDVAISANQLDCQIGEIVSTFGQVQVVGRQVLLF
jgi:hypothetical protein